LTDNIIFKDLGLDEKILRAIDDAGYANPTEIQAKAIPAVLMMKDVIGIAQTGTGKTASFTLPMIEILQGGVAKARMPRALVLAPTRELAAQVAENIEKYAKYLQLSHALIVGGVQAADQVAKLERGVDILIATPGRLLDLFERGNVLLNDIKFLVIDEADRMLDMGFIPDIERIIKIVPPLKQSLLFSATFAKPIKKLAEELMDNPKMIEVAKQSSTALTVTQKLIVLKSQRDKTRSLVDKVKQENVDTAFVFCNRKKDIDGYANALIKAGVKAGSLHGDMAQTSRTKTLNSFKTGEIKILVCSDVAGRGIDISDIGHVFNMDLPMNAEDYVHRIGRTGRAGKTGCAFSFAVLPHDDKFLEAIEKLIGQTIERDSVQQTSKTDKPKSLANNDRKNVKDTRKSERPKPYADQDDGPSPIGFGSDLPDFMNIKSNLPKS
jgi:superfamily II DNA/RNA helicase